MLQFLSYFRFMIGKFFLCFQGNTFQDQDLIDFWNFVALLCCTLKTRTGNGADLARTVTLCIKNYVSAASRIFSVGYLQKELKPLKTFSKLQVHVKSVKHQDFIQKVMPRFFLENSCCEPKTELFVRMSFLLPILKPAQNTKHFKTIYI